VICAIRTLRVLNQSLNAYRVQKNQESGMQRPDLSVRTAPLLNVSITGHKNE
jgi:hypothetical protein